MRYLSLGLLAGLALAAAGPGRVSAQSPYLAYPYAGAPYPIPYYAPPSHGAFPDGGYARYGFPGNYFAPTVQSYGPYAPHVGSNSSYYGMPIFSLTYRNADGTSATYVQSYSGQRDDLRLYYSAGYPGYTSPFPYYSYGQSGLPSASPAVPSYGGSIFTPTGLTSHYVGAGAPTSSGTMGFGVTPNQ
jgi:hypothetical protein